MVELRFLIVELRYLGVDWDCLKISYDFKENLKIDFHQGYIKRNFYIPKSVRCCKDHYLINSLYDDCFSKIPVLRFRTKCDILWDIPVPEIYS